MNAPPEDTPTRVGGRYRLDERIGAGAMGAVWRATDELLDRTVAVKELLAAAAPPTAAGVDALEESRQRILREGRIGARLQHPHVISMFDVVVHDDRPWLVMEYLPSRSLAQVLSEKGPMEPREAAEVGRQVADGLAAAHVAGVVHRDVKPGNVLIASDGRVKLTDFGVSRAVDDVQLTRTGLIAGTPAFLSPEVARGQAPTAASDVFALGATLYAAVEGHPPFGLDDNAYALLHKVAGGIVEPPRQAGPLTGVMMRLLAADPADRPSAAQARDALAAVAAGRAVGAGTGATTTAMMPAPVPPRPAPASEYPDYIDAEPPERRSRVPLILGVIALLVLGGGVVAAILAGQSGNGAVPPAPSTTTAAAPTTGARSTTTRCAHLAAHDHGDHDDDRPSVVERFDDSHDRASRVRAELLRSPAREHRRGVRAAQPAGAERIRGAERLRELLRGHPIGERAGRTADRGQHRQRDGGLPEDERHDHQRALPLRDDHRRRRLDDHAVVQPGVDREAGT